MALHSEIEIAGVVELYRFTRLEQSKFYTSADTDIEYGGYTYKKASIKRSAIPSVFSAERQQVTIEASVSDVFSFLSADAPSSKLRVTITRYSTVTMEAAQIFAGYMDTYAMGDRHLSVTFLSDCYQLDTVVPRVRMITICNHLLYDGHCTLKRPDWRVTVRVTLIWNQPGDGNFIEIESKAPDNFGKNVTDYTASRYDFSILEFNNYFKLITVCVEGFTPEELTKRILKIISPFPSGTLKVGSIAYLYPGCNRDPATCRDSFNNLTNFLGFPYLPKAYTFEDVVSHDGDPIPLLYGTLRLPIKLIDATRAGSSTSENGVLWGFWAAVCYGPITWKKLACPKRIWPYYYDLTDPAQKAIAFQGSNTGDPTDGSMPTPSISLYNPTARQFVSPERGVAHFWCFFPTALDVMDYNTEPEKTVTVEVTRALAAFPVTPAWITGDYEGVSPAAAIYDILTNTLYGVGLAATLLDLDSFDTVSAYCQTKSYSLNFCWDKQTSARAMIEQLCEMYGFMLTINTAGKIALIAMNSTDTLAVAASLTEAEVLALSLVRGSWDSTANRIIAKVTGGVYIVTIPTQIFANGETIGASGIYADKIIANDTASQMLVGAIKQAEVDLTGFKTTSNGLNAPAYQRAFEILKERSNPRMRGTVVVPLKYDALIPGNTIQITHADYGVSAIFIIRGRDFPDNDSDQITLEIEQISESVLDANYQTSGDASLRSGGSIAVYDSDEKLYFDPFSYTSEVSTNTYTTHANMTVKIDAGDGSLLQLDATDYTINDEGGGVVSVTLAAAWSTAVESNSLGSLYVAVNEMEL